MKPKKKALELCEQMRLLLGYEFDSKNDNLNRALSIMAEYSAYKITEEIIIELIDHHSNKIETIERLEYWEKVQKHINKL